jgi:hypothetical protein
VVSIGSSGAGRTDRLSLLERRAHGRIGPVAEGEQLAAFEAAKVLCGAHQRPALRGVVKTQGHSASRDAEGPILSVLCADTPSGAAGSHENLPCSVKNE